MANSHVQLPKFIIKQFAVSEKDGRVETLNLEDGTIKKQAPKNIGICSDYFDKETEVWLSRKYEAPFASIIDKLKKAEKENLSINLSKEDLNTINSFIGSLFLRKPYIVNRVNDRSESAALLNVRFSPSFIVKRIDKISFIAEIGKFHYPIVFFNKTGTSFISSVSGLTVDKDQYEDVFWFLPITPTIAIYYAGEKSFNSNYNCANSVSIKDNQVVKDFNEAMTKAAMNDKNKCIFLMKSTNSKDWEVSFN